MSAGAGDRAPEVQPLDVWRGSVNPWRCDEMGHMNMRYYLAIAEEGLASIAHALGQPRAFVRGAGSTLQTRAWSVRFLREARAGDSLHATAGVLEMGEHDARLLQVIRHADGRPAASVVATAVHATPEGRAFAWSDRARAAAERLRCQLPPEIAPRNAPAPETLAPSAERAETLGLACIAGGAVGAEECDAFGQMTATAIFGRVADGMLTLSGPLRRAVAAAMPDVPVGGAALEYVLELRRPPRAGDLIQVRSGVARVGEKVMQLRHWLLDPTGGEPYGALAGVGATLDLDARRILPIPAGLRARFETPGLD